MRLVAIAARVSFAATLATALLLLGPAIARQYGLIAYPPARLLITLGTFVGVLALAAGLGWWIARLRSGVTTAARYGYVGLVGAIALMIVPLDMLWLAFTMPQINEVTTDPETPPALALSPPPSYEGQKQLSYDGETITAIEAQKRAYPEIKPFKVIQPEKVLFWRAFAVAKDMGWRDVSFDKANLAISASDTRFWSGATSDIGIRVKKAGMGARLDIRSRSRAPGTDAGENAAIIQAYYKALAGK